MRKQKRHRSSGTTVVACPYCGQTDTLAVDPGGGEHQEYIEDCAVCCRPRTVHVEFGDDPDEPFVWVERTDA